MSRQLLKYYNLLCKSKHFDTYGYNEVLESSPSFCNGLRTIYIASSRGKTFWSYYHRYGFGVKVRSWECVRHPKHWLPIIVSYVLILLKANSIFVSNSHTHASIHLIINMASIIPNHTSIMAYPSIHLVNNLSYI